MAPRSTAAAGDSNRSQSQSPLRPRRSEEAQKRSKRKIAKLDDEKRAANDALLSGDRRRRGPTPARRLARLTTELATLEDEWLTLSADAE